MRAHKDLWAESAMPRLRMAALLAALVVAVAACAGQPRPGSVPQVTATPRVARLIDQLHSRDAVERTRAARELQREPHAEAAIPALIELLGDTAKINLRLDPPDVSPGYFPSPGEESARALARIGKPAVGPLLTVLKDRKSAGSALAARALGMMQRKAVVPPLIVALKDPRPEVRAEAAYGLGLTKDPRALLPLIAATRDSHAAVRSNALMCLDAFPDPRIVDPLIDGLHDRDADVAAIASATLGTLRFRGLEQRLIAETRDATPEVRAAAAWALRDRQSSAVVRTLSGLLHDRSSRVRLAAVQTLTRTNSALGIEPLIFAVSDADAEVAAAAARALAGISGRNFGRDPSAWREWWKQNKQSLLAKPR